MKCAIPTVITHPRTLVREGLRQILTRTRFRAMHTATHLDDISVQISEHPKCLWLMGVDTFSPAIFESLRGVRANCPELTIVVLAESETDHYVWRALDAGANGFLDHDISLERLVTALEFFMLGEMVVPARCLHAVRGRLSGELIVQAPTAQVAPATPAVNSTERLTDRHIAGIAPRLSSREIAILRLLMNGASNKVIARQLAITEATVKVHNKAILRKIRVQNRTQAAVWAHNHLDQGYSGTSGAIAL